MLSRHERYRWALPLTNTVARFAVVWVQIRPSPLPPPVAASRIGAANAT